MEVHFNNGYLEKLYAGFQVSGKPRYADEVIEKFRKRIVLLIIIENTEQLRNFRRLNFEAIKGDKKGLCSIRVDLKYRLEFSIEKDKIMLHELIFIENLSNHYR
jgi:proteic killer suppression protein